MDYCIKPKTFSIYGKAENRKRVSNNQNQNLLWQIFIVRIVEHNAQVFQV